MPNRRAAAAPELHIFDFDGVLFHSPAPSPRLRLSGLPGGREGLPGGRGGRPGGGGSFRLLELPLVDGGLGWFQSLATLSPPAVPERPPVDRWFVAPVQQRLRALAQRTDHVAVAVLTGRDEKFRARIEALLEHAEIRERMCAIKLKPHETYGTVRHKLECFHALIEEHQPAHVFYYKDRPEQGAHPLSGLRRLATAVNPHAQISTVFLADDGNLTPGELNCDFRGRAAERWWEAAEAKIREGSSLSTFDFTLVMVDPEFARISEECLDKKTEEDLIAQLWREKKAYDAMLSTQSPKKGTGTDK